MSAEELLKEGDLSGALDELQGRVRADPGNDRHRVFLFQLLAVLGQWERAVTQLKVIGGVNASALPMAQTYREAIRCEVLREKVFAGERAPMVFGEPQRWVALVLEALQAQSRGEFAQAETLRGEAFEQAPASAGHIGGEAFEWIADADPRLGPMLEAIVHGRYYWVPFNQIRSLSIEAPSDLRDVVWAPTSFTWANEGEAVGFIPARYAGTHACEDSALRLGRRTDWREEADGVYTGLGQRMLATDAGEYPLLEVREVVLAETGAVADATADG